MANWWDNGIKGNSMSNNFAVSSGLAVAVPNTQMYKVANPNIIGSVPLKETLDTDVSTYLLLTTESGTQIYAIVTSNYSDTTSHVYRPEEYVHLVYHTIKFKLKKGGTELTFETNYQLPTFIAGDPNPYNYKIRNGPSERVAMSFSFGDAFPAAKESAVSQLICFANDNGIDFYELGYAGTYYGLDGTTAYSGTATRYVGRIPASALTNTFWFEPTEDFLTPQQADQSGTGSGRGEGVYDYPGEDVGFPALPTTSVLNIANYKMFNPTGAQLGGVIGKLWFEDFSLTELIEVIQRFIFKPKESLVSVTMLPFNVNSGSSERVYLGKMDTGVDAPVVTSQFQTIDCGSINVPLRYASVLDYSPFQKAVLFIPFVGFRNINVDQIAGGTIAIKYNVDVLTGSAVCFVRITDGQDSNNSVLYTYDCNLAIQVPVSSDKYDAMVSSLLHLGGALIGAAGGGQFGVSTAAQAIPSAIDAISAAHGIDQSGQLASTVGILGEFTPYLVLEQVNQSLPAGYNSHEGYPSNITSQLGSLSGYTEVEKIHLNIPEASSEELAEIESLLTSGVIL